MIVVHHLENSRSQRILWLLEELGIEYELKHYERDRVTSLAPLELIQVHPLGKAPVITDGERTVAESGAIVEYLVNTYGNGKLKPADGSPGSFAYLYWMHYAEGTFMPLMIMSLIMNRIENAKVPFFVKPVARGIVKKVRDGYLDPNIKRNLDFMESALASSRWFCGDDFTAADIMMSFPVEAAEVRVDLTADYPHLNGFLKRIRSRAAYKRALEKGGPYKLLGSD